MKIEKVDGSLARSMLEDVGGLLCLVAFLGSFDRCPLLVARGSLHGVLGNSRSLDALRRSADSD